MTYADFRKAFIQLINQCAKSQLSGEEIRSIVSEILDEMVQEIEDENKDDNMETTG